MPRIMRPRLAWLLLAMPLVGGADTPSRVTTVTPEYCAELSTLAKARTGGAPGPAARMAQEGRELCAQGHVRAGIHKLRRAIALLPHPP